MSNIYKIDLIKISQENLKEVFLILEEKFSELNIDFYLIGAIAKDIWMSGVHEVSLGRITRDLDIAVLIETSDKFVELKENLIDSGRFTPIKDSAYTLIFDNSIQLDMLPFGGMNIEDINFSKTIAVAIAANGFAEVHQNALAQIEIKGKSFAVSTLPGIVLLKLIAYDDRPEHRQKDLQDIGSILKVYHRINDELLFEDNYVDLLEIESPLKSAAQLLGRQLYLIINTSEVLLERIGRILDKYYLVMEEEFLKESSSIDILKEIKKGLFHQKGD